MSFIALETLGVLFVTRRLIHPSRFTRIPSQKETAVLASMASNTIFLLNHEQNGVTIAIETDFFYLLGVPRFFTLVPQLLP
jgi:hypothetical protein